jgi:membrane protein
LAAALAYYGMFSFAPVIFIAISITGLFFEDVRVASKFFQRLEGILGPEVSRLVSESVAALSKTPASTSILISIISFLALLYAASGLFYQLQFSLNTIWRVPPHRKGQTTSFIRQRLFSFIIVIGIGLLGVLAAFANLLLSWFGSTLQRLFGIDANLVLAARIAVPVLVAVTIALFYKILPETKVNWRDVWPGAVIATILILIAVFLAGLFFQFSSISSALQAAGAFTVLLVSFYYVAQIFLLGAVCCRISAGLRGFQRPVVE